MARIVGRRVAVPVAVGIVAVGVAAIATGDGPLDTSGGVGICGPAPAAGSETYTGVFLDNDGSRPLHIIEVRATGSNLAAVTMVVDVEGPALGETVGTIVWPATDGPGYADAMMARAVPPADADISPGVDAQMIVSLTAEDPQQPATIERFEVTYTSGLRHFTESLTGYEITEMPPGQPCAASDDVSAA